MSEQFPMSDEYAAQPPNDEYIDVRETSEWIDVLDRVQSAEKAMLIYTDPTDTYTCSLAAQYAVEIGQILGHEYMCQPSHIVGLAHTDTMLDDTVVLNTQNITFVGCDMKFIKDRWRAAFEFYLDDTNPTLPAGSYYVPVDQHHILDLKIRTDLDSDEQTAVQAIFEQAKEAQSVVTTADFALLAADAQRKLLQNICDSADSDTPRDMRDCRVDIDCERYYTRYDDMPGIDLRSFLTDGSAIDENNPFRLPHGIIVGYDYPEIEDLPPDQVLNAWNFDIAAGAPCLVVRNTDEACTYYIPPLTVTDIVSS